MSDVQCFDQLVKINPETGKTAMVDLPFDTEDMAFDPDGLAYLRTDSILARYDSRNWREVPFDYGRMNFRTLRGHAASLTCYHDGKPLGR